MELFTSIIEQLKKTQMTKIENALVWLYVKSWNKFGQHVLDEENLWNFGGEDLEAALMGFIYKKKNVNTERAKAGTKFSFCAQSLISSFRMSVNLYPFKGTAQFDYGTF